MNDYLTLLEHPLFKNAQKMPYSSLFCAEGGDGTLLVTEVVAAYLRPEFVLRVEANLDVGAEWIGPLVLQIRRQTK